jgi:hypothetical protein
VLYQLSFRSYFELTEVIGQGPTIAKFVTESYVLGTEKFLLK